MRVSSQGERCKRVYDNLSIRGYRRGSLRRRRNLTLVSNVCETVPISLFWVPNGLNELPEVRFEFLFNLIARSTIALISGQSRRVLKSWYTDGDPEQGSGAVSQTDLTRVWFRLWRRLRKRQFERRLNRSREWRYSVLKSGDHNPERATPILGLCHSVFTDQFIFRHILGHFFPKNRISTMSTSAFELWDIKKGKNIIFRYVGFANWFAEFKRYSKFAPKPF